MSRRRSPFRIVLLGLPGAVLVAVLVASLPGGCPGSGGPGGASLTATLRVQPNTDPDDPLVCRLDNGDLGTALVYGSKDDTGRMTGLAALEYWAAGETSVRITFDDRAWPTQFISADGAQVALTYTDATVTAHWHDGQGTTGSATFDLPAGAPGELPQGGETQVTFSNRHLEYAGTWFIFAIITPVMLGFWLWRQTRPVQP